MQHICCSGVPNTHGDIVATKNAGENSHKHKKEVGATKDLRKHFGYIGKSVETINGLFLYGKKEILYFHLLHLSEWCKKFVLYLSTMGMGKSFATDFVAQVCTKPNNQMQRDCSMEGVIPAK